MRYFIKKIKDFNKSFLIMIQILKINSDLFF